MRFSKYTSPDGTITVECDRSHFIARFPRGAENPVYQTFLLGLFSGVHDLRDEDVDQRTINHTNTLD